MCSVSLIINLSIYKLIIFIIIFCIYFKVYICTFFFRLPDKCTESFYVENLISYTRDCKDNILIDKDSYIDSLLQIDVIYSEESTQVVSGESCDEDSYNYYFHSDDIQVAQGLYFTMEEFHEKLVSLLEESACV